MITSIRLINFERHTNSLIKPSGGINIIYGTTGSGKSAIMRALRWVIDNEPKGNDFIQRGKDSCKVSVVTYTDTGTRVRVTRERTKSKNFYTVKAGKGAPQIYKAMGNTVPEAIEKIFNFGKYNIQQQFDRFFLLQETAGTVAKELNALVGLESIDRHYAAVDTASRTLTAQKKLLEADLEEATKALEAECWSEEDLAELRAIQETIAELETRHAELSSNVTELTAICDSLHKSVIKRKEMDYSEDAIEIIEELKSTYNKQQVMDEKLLALNDMVSALTREVELEALPIVDDVLNAIDSSLKISHRIEDLTERIDSMSELDTMLDEAEDAVHKAENALQVMKDEFGACPLCGGVHEDSMHE